MNRQLIIIGGGNSIQEGIKKGLWKKLKGKFVCGINYAYKYFDSTYLCCLNYTDFYDTNREDLKKLPLIISISRPHPSNWERNTVLLKNVNFRLSGILALYIGIKLNIQEIFLLGYDYSEIKNLTHFYQKEINHRGIGQSQYYNYPGHAERDFEQFKNSKIKIYNVSLGSKINTFPKISYNEFFNRLDKNQYDQKKLKEYIKEKVNGFTE